MSTSTRVTASVHDRRGASILLRNASAERRATLEGILRNVFGTVAADGHGWNVAVRDGDGDSMRAEVQGGWLVLEADAAAELTNRDAWDLLAVAGALPAPVKLVLSAAADEPLLRTEIALETVETAVELEELVASAGRSLADARLVAASTGAVPATQAATTDEAATGDAAWLAAACNETGWAFNERADGRLAVDLPAGRAFRQAELRATAAGCTAAVSMAVPDGLTSEQRVALTIFMLRAAGWVRRVRVARVEADDGTGAVRFEIIVERELRADELDDLLSALAAAAEWCAAEAEALAADRRLAQIYVRGASGRASARWAASAGELRQAG